MGAGLIVLPGEGKGGGRNLRRYPLTYQVHAHPRGVSEVNVPSGHHACDALLIVGIVKDDSGALGFSIGSQDGIEGTPLADQDAWKAWALMATLMAQSPTLSIEQRHMCDRVKRAVQDQTDQHVGVQPGGTLAGAMRTLATEARTFLDKLEESIPLVACSDATLITNLVGPLRRATEAVEEIK